MRSKKTQHPSTEPPKSVGGVYYCQVCGYGYADQKTADDCQEYCTQHSSCSLEITRKAIRTPE